MDGAGCAAGRSVNLAATEVVDHDALPAGPFDDDVAMRRVDLSPGSGHRLPDAHQRLEDRLAVGVPSPAVVYLAGVVRLAVAPLHEAAPLGRDGLDDRRAAAAARLPVDNGTSPARIVDGDDHIVACAEDAVETMPAGVPLVAFGRVARHVDPNPGVDAVEDPSAHDRAGLPHARYSGESGAPGKGLVVDRPDRRGQDYLLQRTAVAECLVANHCEALPQIDGLKACAAIESSAPHQLQAVAQGHAAEAHAAIERERLHFPEAFCGRKVQETRAALEH